ncbi:MULTISPECIES: hypothetical protein [Brachybacterium]|uniref:Uncharacterized protein n=2 Tax=Dermabacteraceae TaxID=85020 RepID=A0ABW0FDU2_9MICO|nr:MULTISPECIES: hypothetical protein [Brachybacterium]
MARSTHGGRRVFGALTSVLLAGAMVLAGTGVAVAEQPASETVSAERVEESLQNVETHDSDLLVAPVSPDAYGADGLGYSVPIGGGSVGVPSDASQGVTFQEAGGETLAIQLPNSEKADSVELLEDGTFTYPDTSSANAVVVTERGVQMLTAIANEEASTSYTYELDLAEEQSIQVTPSGAAMVVDAAGNTVLVFGEPWASDAEGKPVDTWFEVDGPTLTQVVDHQDTENVAYPVVSDPIFLAPWMVKCLVGIGLKGPDITRIAQLGTPYSILAAFGRGAVACIFMK